jgi:hypothetical protein
MEKNNKKKKRKAGPLGEQQHIKNAEYYNNKGVYFSSFVYSYGSELRSFPNLG